MWCASKTSTSCGLSTFCSIAQKKKQKRERKRSVRGAFSSSATTAGASPLLAAPSMIPAGRHVQLQ
jgi:hypothetical protein